MKTLTAILILLLCSCTTMTPDMAEHRIFGDPIALPDLDGGPPAGDVLIYQDSDGNLHQSGVDPGGIAVPLFQESGDIITPIDGNDALSISIPTGGTPSSAIEGVITGSTSNTEVAVIGQINAGNGTAVAGVNGGSGLALFADGLTSLNGGLRLKYREVTASGNILTTDHTVAGNLDGASGDVTMTLPAANTCAGQIFVLHTKDYDISTIYRYKVDGSGSDTINGDTAAYTITNGGTVILQSDGVSNFIILSAF